MERRSRKELRIYKNQALMDELNRFFIAIKVNNHLSGEEPERLLKLQSRYPMPSVSDMDDIMSRLFKVLQEDSAPMRKY